MIGTLTLPDVKDHLCRWCFAARGIMEFCDDKFSDRPDIRVYVSKPIIKLLKECEHCSRQIETIEKSKDMN